MIFHANELANIDLTLYSCRARSIAGQLKKKKDKDGQSDNEDAGKYLHSV
jgi:hypothetical protein